MTVDISKLLSFFALDIGGEPELSQQEIKQKVTNSIKKIRKQAEEQPESNVDNLVSKLKGDIREMNGLPRDWEPKIK